MLGFDGFIWVCVNCIVDDHMPKAEIILIEGGYNRMTKQNPLFTATVDQQGRISILKRYRDKMGIKTGDMIDVFDMKKVE